MPNINSVFDASVIPCVAIFEHTSPYISADGRFFFAGYDLLSGGTGFVLVTTQALRDELVGLGIVVDVVGSWTTMEGTIPSQGVNTSVIWAGSDLIGSYPDYVSDPISLDGYNVIEWDGDTTGLAYITYDNSPLYRVGDFIPFTEREFSCIGVMAESTPLYELVTVDVGNIDVNWVGFSNDITVAASFGDNNVTSALGHSPGTYFYKDSDDIYLHLFAYPSTETPPDEGGGDDDDPQPPLGG